MRAFLFGENIPQKKNLKEENRGKVGEMLRKSKLGSVSGKWIYAAAWALR